MLGGFILSPARFYCIQDNNIACNKKRSHKPKE